jgi:8-oxo-dGTP pyrophosphatase MutT (NUDIX family)
VIDGEFVDATAELAEAAADLVTHLKAIGLEAYDAIADIIKDFSLGASGSPQLVPYDLAGQRPAQTPFGITSSGSVQAAGIAVVSQDSGRCLLIQRSNKDLDDPAHGTWEFPGGKCEQGESAFVCAQREWEEEMGVKLPAGTIAGQWTSANGVYRCYVWLIQREDQIALHEGRDEVLNPDDPDKDDIESAAWWDPGDLHNMPALRQELRDQGDFGLLRSFRRAKGALAELEKLRSYLRHGKDIERFVPQLLPEAEYQRIKTLVTKLSPVGHVLAASRQRLLAKAGPPARAMRRAWLRDVALQSVMNTLAKQLGQIAARNPKALEPRGKKLLREAYAEAYFLGRRHASALKQAGDEGEEGWGDLPPDVQAELGAKVDKQGSFLKDLALGILGGLALDALAKSFDNYAETTIGVYESGYQDGAGTALQQDGNGGIMATWVVTAEDPCQLCEQKDGQMWPMEEAPLPGDGDFGEICEGAYHCRCVLEYEWVPADEQDVAA